MIKLPLADALKLIELIDDGTYPASSLTKDNRLIVYDNLKKEVFRRIDAGEHDD